MERLQLSDPGECKTSGEPLELLCIDLHGSVRGGPDELPAIALALAATPGCHAVPWSHPDCGTWWFSESGDSAHISDAVAFDYDARACVAFARMPGDAAAPKIIAIELPQAEPIAHEMGPLF